MTLGAGFRGMDGVAIFSDRLYTTERMKWHATKVHCHGTNALKVVVAMSGDGPIATMATQDFFRELSGLKDVDVQQIIESITEASDRVFSKPYLIPTSRRTAEFPILLVAIWTQKDFY